MLFRFFSGSRRRDFYKVMVQFRIEQLRYALSVADDFAANMARKLPDHYQMKFHLFLCELQVAARQRLG